MARPYLWVVEILGVWTVFRWETWFMPKTTIPSFENSQPSGLRFTVTGSTNSVDDPGLDAYSLGESVTLTVVGHISAVNHKVIKDGTIERQHVVQADTIRFH